MNLTKGTYVPGVGRKSILPSVALKDQGEQRFHPEKFFWNSFMPYEMAHMMIEHIDKKRKALGIDKARERVLFDMAARRELEAV